MLKRFKGVGWRRTRAFTLKGAGKLAEAHEQARETNTRVLKYIDVAMRGPLGQGKISKPAMEFKKYFDIYPIEYIEGSKIIFSTAGSIIGGVGGWGIADWGTIGSNLPFHTIALAGATAALLGGAGGYRAGKKLSELNTLHELRKSYDKLELQLGIGLRDNPDCLHYDRDYAIPQLLAEIALERRQNETVALHFKRINEYLNRLRSANEMHDFCINALRNQIQSIEKRKKN